VNPKRSSVQDVKRSWHNVRYVPAHTDGSDRRIDPFHLWSGRGRVGDGSLLQEENEDKVIRHPELDPGSGISFAAERVDSESSPE